MNHKSLLKRPLLLTAFLLLILSFSFKIPLYAKEALTDSKGQEVGLPDRPVIISSSPGMWQSVAPHHTPQIKTKIRKAGLETERELILKFPEPFNEEDPDRIIKIYVREKDGEYIGFYEFSDGEQEFTMRMTAVINYIQIYIECTPHGLWRQDIRFEKA